MTVQIEVQYRPRPGYGINPKDAAIIGPELARLAEEGSVTPKAVVDAARPEQAPLHRYFEWNDHVAAEAHRRWQARHMTRGIIIEVPTDKGDVDVPAFYSVQMDEDDPDREYVPVMNLLADPELVARQLLRFGRDIKRLRDEYTIFRRISGFEQKAGQVMKAIDETLNNDAA